MAGNELADLLNLGGRSAQMLHDAGIHTVRQLRELGAVEAYLQIRRRGTPVSLNMLYAIEGALTHTHWTRLDRATREALLMAVDVGDSR